MWSNTDLDQLTLDNNTVFSTEEPKPLNAYTKHTRPLSIELLIGRCRTSEAVHWSAPSLWPAPVAVFFPGLNQSSDLIPNQATSRHQSEVEKERWHRLSNPLIKYHGSYWLIETSIKSQVKCRLNVKVKGVTKTRREKKDRYFIEASGNTKVQFKWMFSPYPHTD